MNARLRGYEQHVGGFRVSVVIMLFTAIPFALGTGFYGGWDGGTAFQAAVFGVALAAVYWFRPPRPGGVSEDVWDALPRAQRRAALEALDRGEPLPASVSPGLAAEITKSLKPKRRSRWAWVGDALALVPIAGVVPAAAADGAPPGWIAAGCVYAAVVIAVRLRSEMRSGPGMSRPRPAPPRS